MTGIVVTETRHKAYRLLISTDCELWDLRIAEPRHVQIWR